MKSKLISRAKVRKDNGNIVEVKIWQVNPSADKPRGYKYSLVYIVKGKRVIGYDNAEGKGDHRHYGDRIEKYNFRDLERLSEDFYSDIEKYEEGNL